MRKKKHTDKAAEVLAKLMKEGHDLEAAMAKMRTRGIAPMEMVISLTKVLNMSLDEADKVLLNSDAYGDIKTETLQLRRIGHETLMEQADEIIEKPNGEIVLEFDLEEEE